jgi:hypothetical protein
VLGAERIEVERACRRCGKDAGNTRNGGSEQTIALHDECTRVAGTAIAAGPKN